MVDQWFACERSGLRRVMWRGGHVVACAGILMALFLSGCAGKSPSVDAWRRKEGWTSDRMRSEVVAAQGFRLMAVRVGQGPVARIYIEGDGLAYISQGTPSGDPTPRNPVGLKLAMAGGDGGLYLARPCQWVREVYCKNKAPWTTARFTPEVVAAYVEIVRGESLGRPVELIGYSGGAWIALQVAARLDNVSRVVTVAGNMMPSWVNAQHKVSPIEVAAYPEGRRLRELPVVAYVGRQDKVVGYGVVAAYAMATDAQNVRVIEVEASHSEGWDKLDIR